MERASIQNGQRLGEQVLEEAHRLAQLAWGDRLIAAYALGSLAHGASALMSVTWTWRSFWVTRCRTARYGKDVQQRLIAGNCVLSMSTRQLLLSLPLPGCT